MKSQYAEQRQLDLETEYELKVKQHQIKCRELSAKCRGISGIETPNYDAYLEKCTRPLRGGFNY